MSKLEELRAAMEQGDTRKVELIALAAVKELERRENKTWLAPIAAAYEEEMGAGSFHTLYGRAGKALAGLYKAGNTPEDIARRLGYCIRTMRRNGEMRFFSLERFSASYNDFNPDEPAFDDEPV